MKFRFAEVQGPKCLMCGTPLYGRAGKKFCCSGCKNTFHNLERSRMRQKERILHSRLFKNHEILRKVLESGKSSIPTSYAISRGFDPETFSTKKYEKHGQTRYLCLGIEYTLTVQEISGIREKKL